jgi:photosystem II stability/assembly factor-like uncharacterized protein
MPRNSNGVYSPPAGTEGIPNTVIRSDRYNAFVADLTNDLNNARPVSSGGTGSTNATDAAAGLGFVSAADLAGVNTIGGTANAITVTTARVYTVYANTVYLAIRPTVTNSGPVTVNLSGLGAKKLLKMVEGGTAELAAGELLNQVIYTIRYSTTADSGQGAFLVLGGGTGSGLQIGDFLDTVRNPGSTFLRRNGGLYDIDEYPTLAALLPPLEAGILWTVITAPFGSAQSQGIAVDEGNERIMTVAGSSIYYTDDGENWTTVAIPLTATGYQSIAYGGGRWVVFGGGATTVSADGGDTWSSPAAAFGPSISGRLVYAAGLFALGHFTPFSSDGELSTSPDGVVWTTRLGPGPSMSTYDCLLGDSVGFVARRSDGFFYTSADGITWDQVTPSENTQQMYGAAKNGSSVVLVGASGRIFTTDPDYEIVTQRTSGTTNTLFSVIYRAPYFIAIGGGGVCRFSDDNGATWEAATTGTSADLYNLVINPIEENELIAVGNGVMLTGAALLSTQFQVPDDDPEYGWIKALN